MTSFKLITPAKTLFPNQVPLGGRGWTGILEGAVRPAVPACPCCALPCLAGSLEPYPCLCKAPLGSPPQVLGRAYPRLRAQTRCAPGPPGGLTGDGPGDGGQGSWRKGSESVRAPLSGPPLPTGMGMTMTLRLTWQEGRLPRSQSHTITC